MLRRKLLTIFLMIAALGIGCAPVFTETPAPIKTEAPSVPVTGVAVVESIEIQILESMPVQVQAVIRGQLPDAGCTSIRDVTQVREGNTIKLTLTTTTDPLALCAQALTPFEHVVSLNVSDLPAGEYTVDLGGVQQTFMLPAADMPTFQQSLLAALNARDYETLKGMMDESFMIGYWLSEGVSSTPEQAIEQLQLNLLNGSSPITADTSKDLTALLGTDPVTIVEPNITNVSPIFVSGLGEEGQDEAILFTAERPDGTFYWYGMLFAKDGFAQ